MDVSRMEKLEHGEEEDEVEDVLQVQEDDLFRPTVARSSESKEKVVEEETEEEEEAMEYMSSLTKLLSDTQADGLMNPGNTASKIN